MLDITLPKVLWLVRPGTQVVWLWNPHPEPLGETALMKKDSFCERYVSIYTCICGFVCLYYFISNKDSTCLTLQHSTMYILDS